MAHPQYRKSFQQSLKLPSSRFDHSGRRNRIPLICSVQEVWVVFASRFARKGSESTLDTLLDREAGGEHNSVQVLVISLLLSCTVWNIMSEFMDHPLARSAVLMAAIFLTTALGLAVVRKFRGRADRDKHGSSELLTKFRELHARGGLSDEEYRTIKTKLADQLQVEVSDNSSTG